MNDVTHSRIHLSSHLGGQLEIATGETVYSRTHHVTEPIHDGLRILVVLSGEMTLHAGRNAPIDVHRPTSLAVLSDGPSAREQYFASDKLFKAVLLTVDRNLIMSELGVEPHELLAPEADIEGDGLLIRTSGADAAVRAVASQIFVVGERENEFYRCAKAMELAALVLDRFRSPVPRADAFRLSPSERDTIRAARDLLVGSMVSPPDIETLARQCGTNPLKLNRGFRSLYGKTPYAYLQECRLQTGYQLLSSGQLPVSQVAAMTGYTRTHFANLFRRRFGMMPSELLRRGSDEPDAGPV